MVGRQITDHLKRCELMPVLQSAYRSGHSTEICLLKVMSDILDAADSGEVSLVGLLDLSAAFDTVDHEILLHHLKSSFGIGGVILDWIGSFLTTEHRQWCFAVKGRLSVDWTVAFRMVLSWDLCFLSSIQQTSSALQAAWVWKYIAMQMIHSCISVDLRKTWQRQLLEWLSGINAISTWMSSNHLKLNGDKTQFIWMGSCQRLMKIQQAALFVQGAELSPLSSVRDLGFIMDSKLTMSDHVSSVVRSCFFQLRQLRFVCHSLPAEARRSLIHCFISCRIDYCNANLYGISSVLLRRLQTVLNAAARLVVDAGKRQHMTPKLKDLHWLPVKERILYKIGILTFQCVRGTGPDYLVEMFTRVSTWRTMLAFDRLFVVTLSHPGGTLQLFVNGVFASPVQLFGTSYPSIWGIKTFHINNLRANWNLFCLSKPTGHFCNLVNGRLGPPPTNDYLLYYFYYYFYKFYQVLARYAKMPLNTSSV